jgi:hypothetical protein
MLPTSRPAHRRRDEGSSEPSGGSYELPCELLSTNRAGSRLPIAAVCLAGEGPGRRADLVLLDANPLDGLGVLRHPRAVIAHGRVLARAALDAMEAGLIAAGAAQ